MRILSLLLILAMLCGITACGTDPDPADTSADSDSGDTTPAETTPAETDPPEEEVDPSYAPSSEGFEVVSEDGTYKLVFSKASVVQQGEPGDATWGHYNFPKLSFTKEGFIICSWAYSTDTIDYKPAPAGMNLKKISVNKGKSWMLPTALDSANSLTDDRIMGNGKYYLGFGGHAAHKVDYLFDYEPQYTWGDGYNQYKMFFVDDVKDDPSEDAATDTKVFCNIYDPETKTTEQIECVVNWPYAPLTQHPGNKAYPLKMCFSLQGGSNIVIDGIPYALVYCKGFDSFADSREEAVDEYSKYYACYILNSPDYGTTWNLISQIRLDDELFEEASSQSPGTFEGFCEPMISVAPDGTLVMLMRTGSNNPSYVCYSSDNGYTWTYPEKFDECGVLPQIVTLDCGVTLATYGRPYMYFRSTNDESGKNWDEHITVPLCTEPNTSNYMKVSCFNNDMVILDEDTVMFAYTDFRYPNKDGVKVKTVLTRTVDVVFLED